MRTFIGIEFDKNLKDKLEELQNVIKDVTVKGRWKHRDNFHLTLKFLGEVTPPVKEQVAASLVAICSSSGSFRLIPGKIGQFKGRDNIRVLWLGLDGEIEKLLSLQGKVDNAMHGLGFARESRLYTPHITLAQDLYVESGFQTLQKSIEGFTFPEIIAERVHLFSSEQIGNKRVYTSIAEFGLE